MIALPGGMPGAEHLKNDPRIADVVRRLHAAGRPVAAICAAPMVLAAAGVLRGPPRDQLSRLPRGRGGVHRGRRRGGRGPRRDHLARARHGARLRARAGRGTRGPRGAPGDRVAPRAREAGRRMTETRRTSPASRRRRGTCGARWSQQDEHASILKQPRARGLLVLLAVALYALALGAPPAVRAPAVRRDRGLRARSSSPSAGAASRCGARAAASRSAPPRWSSSSPSWRAGPAAR